MAKLKIFLLIALISITSIMLNCGKMSDTHLSEEELAIQEKVNRAAVETGITVEDIAYHWAPVHYQDINPVGDDESRADYITRVDRDLPGKEGGIWDLSQNYDKKLRYPLRAYVYFSVVTTETHIYINYSFFHPWDTWVNNNHMVCDTFPYTDTCKPWTIDFIRAREGWDKNDLEGVLFVIKRNGSFGELDAVLAQSHGFVFTYLPQSKIDLFNAKRERNQFCGLYFSSEAFSSMSDNVERVITTQEEGGHGAGCYPDWGAPSPNNPEYIFTQTFVNGGGGNHIRYIPSRTVAAEPDYDKIHYDEYGNEKQGDNRFTYCKYKLINMLDPDGGLWAHRDEAKVFQYANRVFQGDHGDPTWCWGGVKVGTFEKSGPVFTEEDLYLASKPMHPFTHNPANLSWVHLKRTAGDTKEYFSNNYGLNDFRKDNLEYDPNWDFLKECDKRPCKENTCVKCSNNVCDD